LEDSITRHKLHLIKLELILRLLDNGGLSPDEVNEVKDFVEDYIERNQVLTFVFLFDHLEELF
jgi:CCR4-NOT transcription complex subunit 3